jgi:hypothetical protein
VSELVLDELPVPLIEQLGHMGVHRPGHLEDIFDLSKIQAGHL